MADDTNYNMDRPPSNQTYSNRDERDGAHTYRDPPHSNHSYSNRDERGGAQTYRDPPPTYEATTTAYPTREQGPARSQYNTSQQHHSDPRSYQQQQHLNQGYNSYRQTQQPPKESRQDREYHQGQSTNRQPARPDSRPYQQTNGERLPSRQQQAPSQPIAPVQQQDDTGHRETSSLTLSGSTNLVSVSQQDLRARGNSEYNQRPNQSRSGNRGQSKNVDLKINNVDESLSAIISDIEEVKGELKEELDTRRKLEKTLTDTEREKKDLNSKLAALRVKLGVANANINVGKSEIDQIRTKFQEAQIHKARLEERINTCSVDLERMRDPSNPDSNVNMKKLVSNDRKEIRRLRLELESAHEERDDSHKHLSEKEMRIKELELQIIQAAEKKDRVQTDLELALSHKELEYLERQEIEKKYNELLNEKKVFDEKVSGIKDKIGTTSTGMNEMQRKAEEYRKKEDSTRSKVDKLEKQLRDVLTEIEQLKSKGRGMPARIAGSIKDHQYRMSKGGKITDTVPAGNLMDEPGKASTNAKPGGKANLANFVPQPKARGVNPKTKVR